MELVQLVYISSAVKECGADCFRQIAHEANERNTASNITGILMVYNQTVMQFIEGPQEEVDTAFAIIQKDERHKNVIRIFYAPIEERQFSEWSMAFQDEIKPSDPPYFHEIKDRSLYDILPDSLSRQARSLVSAFKVSSGLAMALR